MVWNCNTQGMIENSSIIQYGLPIILLSLLAIGIIYFLIKIYNQDYQLKQKLKGGEEKWQKIR